MSCACGKSTPIAPHALALLRALRERPRERRATDKPDEFAFRRITSRQSRGPESRWARLAPPTERIAQRAMLYEAAQSILMHSKKWS